MISKFLSEFRLYLCNKWISNVPSHTARGWFYRNVMGFHIGKNSTIFMNCRFDCAKGLTIGRYTVINAFCRLDPRGMIEIGDNVAISEEVIILTADHDFNHPDFIGRTRMVKIEDFVWIGTRATILPGVTIGEGGVVAAGAVVTKNVEPFTVVAGIPAKKISDRTIRPNTQLPYRRLFQ